MLTIASGYDPLYLTRAVATGRENYYLSAVAEHGEPPGIWTGTGCPELGLAIGSQVDNKVMEGLYGAFLDPRDPAGQATLGRAPSGFDGHNDKIAARIATLLAAEPEATPERRDQLIMQALKEQRAAVYFFDATFSVPKSVSLLHASFQVRAQQARDAGRDEEAGQWIGARAGGVGRHHGRQPGHAGLPAARGGLQPGRLPRQRLRPVRRRAPVGDRVLRPAHQPRQRPPAPRAQRHLEPGAPRRPAGLPARRPDAPGARWTAPPCTRPSPRPRPSPNEPSPNTSPTASAFRRPPGRTATGGKSPGSPRNCARQFSSRRRAIGPRVQELIGEYERKHGKAPNARAVWSMAQFVTLDSRRAKAHSAPTRAALLARWEAQSRRAETAALSAIPDSGPRNGASTAPRRARRPERRWTGSWPRRSRTRSGPGRRSPATS